MSIEPPRSTFSLLQEVGAATATFVGIFVFMGLLPWVLMGMPWDVRGASHVEVVVAIALVMILVIGAGTLLALLLRWAALSLWFWCRSGRDMGWQKVADGKGGKPWPDDEL